MSKGSLPLEETEKRILNIKNEISNLSALRRNALEKHDEKEHLRARIRMVEKALENCQLITNYIANFNPVIAARLQKEHRRVEEELNKMKLVNNTEAFHEWIRNSFAPMVRFSEQTAYLAATCYRSVKEGRASNYRWTRSR
ncbi:MAG: hypothetical protein QXG05_02805 [Nitrososphaerota archaeon]